MSSNISNNMQVLTRATARSPSVVKWEYEVHSGGNANSGTL